MNGNGGGSSKRTTRSILFQLLCLLVGILIMLPLVYALLMSFMPEKEILTKEIHLLPKSFYTGNYNVVFTQISIMRFMLNSFIVAFISSIVRIITSSMAAFSFAFFEYKFKNLFFYLVVGSMIIPADVLIVQNYFTVAGMGLINTYTGMMVIFFVSAMNIFVMRQTFMSYSKSLRDASMVDGCGNFRFFTRILLPSCTPVVTTVFISSFVGTWNTYLWPLLVTNSNQMRTAQVAITMLNVTEASKTHGYGAIMAAAVVILIPSIFTFLLFQKKIVGGMMDGAVKG